MAGLHHPQSIDSGANGLNQLGVGVSPESQSYPGADQAKSTLVQYDTIVGIKDLHANNKFAARLTQAILNSIRAAGEWYIGPDGLPIVHWESTEFGFLSYDFPVQSIAQNPDNGAIPMVQRSVRKFKGNVERFAIGAQFSMAEMQGKDAKDQGVDIIKLVAQQLRACSLETLGAMVMNTLVRPEDHVRRTGILQNAYANWTIESAFQHKKILYGSTSRGEGGFRIALGKVSDERQRLRMSEHDKCIIHQGTRQLLWQDGTAMFVGGERGVTQFVSGKDAVTKFAGLRLLVADTFNVEGKLEPVNELARRRNTGEFYMSTAPGREGEMHPLGWEGFQLYDERRDVIAMLTAKELVENLCWWDATGKPDVPTLTALKDAWNSHDERVRAQPAPPFRLQPGEAGLGGSINDVEVPPHPALMIIQYPNGIRYCDFIVADGIEAPALANISKYWISQATKEAIRNVKSPAAAVEFADAPEGENAVALSRLTTAVRNAELTNGAGQFVRLDGADTDGLSRKLAAHLRAAHVNHITVGASERKMYGVVVALRHLQLVASPMFTKSADNGVYVGVGANVAAMATQHGFVALPMGVDPVNVKRVAAGAAAAAAVEADTGTITMGKSAARPRAAAGVAADAVGGFDMDHIGFQGMAEFAQTIQRLEAIKTGPHSSAQFRLDARLEKETMNAAIREGWFPFQFMVIRDAISRQMASAIVYGSEPGNVLLSKMKSMISSNVMDHHGYVTWEFNAGAFLTTPERTQILPDITYLKYFSGKSVDWVDWNSLDTADGDNELKAWVQDDTRSRGDIIVNAVPIGSCRNLQYCSLSTHFDTEGYPTPVAMPHNSGYYFGHSFIYERMGLAEAESQRIPENAYLVPSQINFNLALGSTWTADRIPMHSGACTLDGGDEIGDKAIRIGDGFRHTGLKSMQTSIMR